MTTSVAAPRFYTLAVIIFAQFAGTSLWFAGNAILPDLQAAWQLPPSALGSLTSAVQAGFITGTFCFAALTLAERFPAHALFLCCAILGAAANLLILLNESLAVLWSCRFLTGFFLAGIYPVGMKIAASWFPQAMGRAIGFLVGALVLGTAFPHFIRYVGADLAWQVVLLLVSGLAILGGILLFAFVGDPRPRGKATSFKPSIVLAAFRENRFRGAALGYFGHMWELYAFWAFVPVFVAAKLDRNLADPKVSLWAFVIIGMGSVGCVAAGLISQRIGSAKPAIVSLAASATCCILSPWIFTLPQVLFFALMLLWGITVIADSAQFSALSAKYAPEGYVGSALTMTTCIGFAISIASLEVLNAAAINGNPSQLLLLLIPGPIIGLWSSRRLW